MMIPHSTIKEQICACATYSTAPYALHSTGNLSKRDNVNLRNAAIITQIKNNIICSNDKVAHNGENSNGISTHSRDKRRIAQANNVAQAITIASSKGRVRASLLVNVVPTQASKFVAVSTCTIFALRNCNVVQTINAPHISHSQVLGLD